MTRVGVVRTRVGVARIQVGGIDTSKRELLRSVVLTNGRLDSVKASTHHSGGLGGRGRVGMSGEVGGGVDARGRFWHDGRCGGGALCLFSSSSAPLISSLLAVAVRADFVLGPHATFALGAVIGRRGGIPSSRTGR